MENEKKETPPQSEVSIESTIPQCYIYRKLHAIMSEVDYIQKDKRNDFHKYTYASEQAIKETLHPLLVKHGVLFNISSISQELVGTVTLARFRYRFIDIETGQFLEGEFDAQGEDKLDKGIWKATTGAIKYIMTSTFLISTGDDPENEDKKPVKQEKVIDHSIDFIKRINGSDSIASLDMVVNEVKLAHKNQKISSNQYMAIGKVSVEKRNKLLSDEADSGWDGKESTKN